MQPDEPAWAEILIPGTKIAKKAAPPVPNDEPAWSDILLRSAKAEKSLSSEEQLHAESDARRRRRVELVEKTAREKAAAKAAIRQAALTARCAIRLQALLRGRRVRAARAGDPPTRQANEKAEVAPSLSAAAPAEALAKDASMEEAKREAARLVAAREAAAEEEEAREAAAASAGQAPEEVAASTVTESPEGVAASTLARPPQAALEQPLECFAGGANAAFTMLLASLTSLCDAKVTHDAS